MFDFVTRNCKVLFVTVWPCVWGTDGSMPWALGAQMKDLFLRSTPVFGAEMMGCGFLVPKKIHRPRGRDGGLGPLEMQAKGGTDSKGE